MSKKKVDKKNTRHGFRVLTDQDDLEEIWDRDNSRDSNSDNFAEMFERSLTQTNQQHLLKEKITGEAARQTLSKKELLKGYPPVEKIVDLHGHTGPEANAATEQLILEAKERGLRTLQIIVGKGHHSDGDPVIPGVVERKLLELKRKGLVMDLEWEKKDRRKSGSLKVYLK